MPDRANPNHLSYGQSLMPPPTRDDIEHAQAIIQKFARHFVGTGEGRTFAECAKLLSKLDINPKSCAARQRGYRLRRLRTDESRYAARAGFQIFARAFLEDAWRYEAHRSQYDDIETGARFEYFPNRSPLRRRRT
ncbi:hypothetical protein [Mesorhizobium sp. L2C066B000]|uniref:hypothetical protein n=1 Tax=Mesorhizobium sp. L2C066B000 TaxID=1287105 RepID=UPI0012DDE18D|nr:hypothetical protein [Mesorhizobium sp. L2C066B000]